jgi:DNA invertase Pin-like site-specific DNA recombinase
MNAVIYARYSSHAQREESIEGQLRVCRDYAGHAGFDVIKEYIDRALTATNDQRPAFQQMIAESASQGFDTVLVYALDRFARDRYDAAVYRKRLKDNGYLTTYLVESSGGPARKYYHITEEGKKYHKEQKSEWESFLRKVEKLI